MTSKRRHSIIVLLSITAVLTALLATGCKPVPTTIVGSVSFLNNPPSEFPPALHPGTVAGDVCYVRLVDNDGAGPAVLWQSPAYPMTFLGNYTYEISGPPPPPPLIQNPTTIEGVYIENFVITLSDAQLAAATMPLRLEAYMYDTTVGVVDPVADFPANRYSYYDVLGDGDPGWRISITIGANEIKTAHLYTTVDFP